MHLKSLQLKDFRGFSDFALADIPATTRLVMLIGPNGMGKSSIFDAFITWSGAHGAGHNWDAAFHVKKSSTERPAWNQTVQSLELHEGNPRDQAAWTRLFYFRSAYRNEPEFQQGNFGSMPDPAARTFYRTIDNDAAVGANYRRLILQTIKDVWGAGTQKNISLKDYANSVVDRVNVSLSRVLPHLKMESLGDPSAQTGNFYFTKGISRGFLFKNLSGGEKAVFDLLIDFITKSSYFDDSIFCIDEPESHVNPSVQGRLLSELLDLTPPKSQLWIATHAIGMLRRARDIEAQFPGTVVFLNFDTNFDQPVRLRPTKMDRETWQQSLAVALDDLSSLVAPKRIIICEGGTGARFIDDGADGSIYNRIFAESQPDTQFFSAGSHADTERAKSMLLALASTILPGIEVKRLIDRDDRSDAEIAAERAKGTRVLSRRNLEAYLFGDEILSLLCTSVGKETEFGEIKRTRDETIALKKTANDDYKNVAGEIYVACKRRLELVKAGNSAKAFMLETLAPLVTEQTETYRQLNADIFG